MQKFADYLNAASQTSPEFSSIRDIITRFDMLAGVHASLLESEAKTTRAMDGIRQQMQEYKRKQSAKILVRPIAQSSATMNVVATSYKNFDVRCSVAFSCSCSVAHA